jgi:RimJ/RimL family protein N-acetyltransferase
MDSYSAIFRLKSSDVSINLFESDRFILRVLRLGQGDYSNYLEWMRDGDSNPFILGVDGDLSLASLQQYIGDKFNSSCSLLLGIYSKNEDLHLGNVKFELIEGLETAFEVGILIGEKDWRNKGVATEVLKHSMAFISKETGISRFELGVHLDNLAAIQTYRKVGFQVIEEKRQNDNLRMFFAC